ncbi:AAA protein, partial [Actinomyces massiliensis F0489]
VERTVHLGLFGFSTYRMWQDLDTDWRTITSNPLVGHLLEAPRSAPVFRDPADSADPAGGAEGESTWDADEVVENLPLVADSDQARVVADAAAGRSLVVEGPPGTGKSQTVANLIFRALAQGRTIMFVAEKTSALDVVARRLRDDVGIGDLLLNLHDNGMKPAEVCEALRHALELQAPDAGAEVDELRGRLARLRGRLGEYREGLHDPRDGASYYRARGELIEERDTEGDGSNGSDGLERARA